MRVKCANCTMVYDNNVKVSACPGCRSNAFDKVEAAPVQANERSNERPERSGPRLLHDELDNRSNLFG